MRSRRRLSAALALCAAALVLTACPSRTNIGKINADPGRYFDKEVAIAGRVTNSYGVPFAGGAYELDDGTGRMWVLTTRSVPSKGAQVGAKGRVLNGPTYSGRTFGTALQESDRRVK
ncbi:MAG TPA: hypothetical protein VER32_15120 [Pyrinomonadaceae bacterium]|nr:hypothetical protein [Pyrinomonadaceae bacterium]